MPSQKPVSSLRSHFERISKPHPNSNPLASRSTTTLPQNSEFDPQEIQKFPRASLDTPRLSAPWQGSDAGTNLSHREDIEHLHARPQRLGLPVTPQRPISMAAMSACSSPPSVNIDPPKFLPQQNRSPQKSGFPDTLPSQRPPRLHLVSAKPPEAYSESHTLPSAGDFVSEDRFEKARKNADKERDGSPLRTSLQNRDLHPGSSNTAKRVVPPPINRADKPQIRWKPSKTESGTALTAFASRSGDRVSPFSTPPSSDEDIRLGVTQQHLDHDRPGPNATVKLTGGRRRTPDALLSNESLSQDKYCKDDTLLTTRTHDARNLGFNTGNDARNKIEIHRPSLPPRKHQENSHQSASMSRSNPGKTYVGPSSVDPYSTKVMASNQRGIRSTNGKSLPILSSRKNPNISQPADPILPNDQSPTDCQSGMEGASDMLHSLDAGLSNTPAYFPDVAKVNRRFPACSAGARSVELGYDARLIDICGRHLCTAGHVARVWDVVTGEILASFCHLEKDVKITSLAFRPATKASEEGSCLWLGTNSGDIQEIDVLSQSINYTKSGAHERREIVRILRHQDSMWSLDDGGRLCVWPGGETGLPSLQRNYKSYRVPRGHTCSVVIQDTLWLATGKEIRLFRPKMGDSADFSVLRLPLGQPHLGTITSGSVVGGQRDRVYFGHADGKISVYSILDYSCLAIVSINVYRINSLAGAGFYLWAAFSIGMMYVYDTRTEPWIVKKGWMAHQGSPVLNLAVDRCGLWRSGELRVASLGPDNTVRLWDGTLKDDWIGERLHSVLFSRTNVASEGDMQDRDVGYCTFREISALVVTWNAGATTPAHLRYDEADSRFFPDLLQSTDSPDLLVFGFQELVDLEDKRLTASMYLALRRRFRLAANIPQKHFLKVVRRGIRQSKNI